MATSADTFQRKEKKYLITSAQCTAIKQALSKRMRLDGYGATRIESLYLDTPDRSLISRSIEKPLYKEKLRVRSYGPFSEASVVYVEIKKKFKGIVYKRRVRMSREAYAAYANGMGYEDAQRAHPVCDGAVDVDLAPGKVQIAREIDAFIDRHEGLSPSMLISCLREAWEPLDPGDGDCVDRITFDEDIAYVDVRSDDRTRKPVTAAGQVVMEVKCAGGYPTWLCEALAEAKAYPQSFSKYGNAYRIVEGPAAAAPRALPGRASRSATAMRPKGPGAWRDALVAFGRFREGVTSGLRAYRGTSPVRRAFAGVQLPHDYS